MGATFYQQAPLRSSYVGEPSDDEQVTCTVRVASRQAWLEHIALLLACVALVTLALKKGTFQSITYRIALKFYCSLLSLSRADFNA